MSNKSYNSFDELMSIVWSVSEEVQAYINDLYKHGLADEMNKEQIQLRVKHMVSSGLSRQQILNEFYNEYEILGPGDILICKGKIFIVAKDTKHITEISIEDAVNILGDRLSDASGEAFILTPNKNTLRGAYIDGRSIWSCGYNTLKIICTHRKHPIRTVCSTTLFNSGEAIKAYLYDGMLVDTVKKRIYRYTKEVSLNYRLKQIIPNIKNSMDIPGMLQAINIIGKGPDVEFRRAVDSETRYFDFINVEFGLSYNGRNYKEQIDYIKKCIKAFDTLAVTAIKIDKTFRDAKVKLSYFKVEKVLTRQNLLVYTFSLKIK